MKTTAQIGKVLAYDSYGQWGTIEVGEIRLPFHFSVVDGVRPVVGKTFEVTMKNGKILKIQ